MHPFRYLALSILLGLSSLSACVSISTPINPTPTPDASTAPNPSASSNTAPNPSASSSPGSSNVEQGLPLGTALYLPFDTEAPTDDTSRRISWTTDRFGKANAAYNFSGVGSYLNVDYNINPGVHPALTMSAWARYTPQPDTSQETSYKLISHAYVYSDRGMGISSTPAGRGWAMEIGFDSIGAAPVTANQWVQVTSVYDQAQKRAVLYVNGEEITQSTEAELGSNDYSYFLVGSNPGYGEHFPGDIDDVRIYERALSKEEVKALYNATKP